VNDREGPDGPQGRAALLEAGLPASPGSPLAYAVPNVSEGRDPATVAGLVDACRVPRVRVLDVHSDPDHDRSVITLAGEPLALQDALVALAGESIDRIDLRRHHGVHPRVGALDVVPIVVLEDEDIPLASEIATGLCERLGAELNLPVFRYGAIATNPDRAAPRDFRGGGVEELERAIADGTMVPDCGPHRLHPTAGAVLVGVRPPLIALNIWLPDGTLTEARTIAARVRESGGGLRSLRALGLYLPQAAMAQVSLNLEDYRVTAPALAIAAVREEAERLGVHAGPAELVGLVPRAALRGPTPSAMGIEGFRPGQVLELLVPGLARGLQAA
jgi:glutamate formiminotransferase